MYSRVADAELLAALIGIRAAHAIAAPLGELLEADERGLGSLGVQAKHRPRILACAELARRYQPKTTACAPISTPRQALSHFGDIRSRNREVLAVLLLDAHLQHKDVQIVAEGGITNVAVTPRDVFACALQSGAAAVILAHNHPSGLVEPSQEDRQFTRTMVEAGRLLRIEVADHLIVGRRSYYSFQEAGML
jgi:DNA repair protein RadC